MSCLEKKKKYVYTRYPLFNVKQNVDAPLFTHLIANVISRWLQANVQKIPILNLTEEKFSI